MADCGKCGGTSMDRTLSPIVRSLSERKDDKYIGNMHYDWSYFELFEKDSVEPIILLRDPISRCVVLFIDFYSIRSRSVSNYHFKKTIPGVANSKQPTYVKFMASSFDTFLEQPEVMVDFAHLWIDSFAGQSSKYWQKFSRTGASQFYRQRASASWTTKIFFGRLTKF